METSKPRALYHYTTQEGLIGIIKSGKGWATHAIFFNDSKEYFYAREQLDKGIDELNGSMDERNRYFFKCLGSSLPDLFPDIFLFSFSEADDLLSLWRGYGNHLGSYSIGFRTERLEVVAAREGFKLLKCIYDPSEHKKIINRLICEILAYHEQLRALPDHLFIEAALNHFWEQFLLLAPSIKNPSFEEEQEWRLVSMSRRAREIQFRPGSSCPVPFLEVPFSDTEGKLPLYHIIVGPTVEPKRSCQAVLRLLTAFGQHSPKSVHPSKIPYRTW
jgi:hypothetical protein